MQVPPATCLTQHTLPPSLLLSSLCSTAGVTGVSMTASYTTSTGTPQPVGSPGTVNVSRTVSPGPSACVDLAVPLWTANPRPSQAAYAPETVCDSQTVTRLTATPAPNFGGGECAR